MITRDSIVLILGILGSIFTYLASADPISQWAYAQWIQFGSFLVGVLIAWLRSSPLAIVGEASKPVLGIFSKKV